jgi:RNA polymerase sigma-70 factor (ECF subfamily)
VRLDGGGAEAQSAAARSVFLAVRSRNMSRSHRCGQVHVVTVNEPKRSTDRMDWDRACGGDGDAFAVVYDRYADRLLGFALRHTGSWTAAEDVVSITFLEVWRRRTQVRFDDQDSIGGWLFGIARNVLRNQSRSTRRNHAAIARLRLASTAPDPSEAVVAQISAEQEVAQLILTLQHLPRRDQEILALVGAGLEPREIATALGIRPDAARARLARARKRLAGHPRNPAAPGTPAICSHPALSKETT